MLACRDPQLEWAEVWRFFDEHRMLASTMRPQTFPAGTMWMQLHTSFTMKSDVNQLFEEGMDCLPKGQCCIPDFGLTKLQEYMSSRGRILDIHCLRPQPQSRGQPLPEEPLSATMPMRVMLRCRVVFPTGSKLFTVEMNTPVDAILALWKGSLRHETDSWEMEDQDLLPIARSS